MGKDNRSLAEGQTSPVKIRLHQFLSRTGQFSSKREVKDAIWSGEVTVAGSVVKDIAFQFNANTKEVCWHDEVLRLPGLHHTFVLNKPTGVICSRLNRQEQAFGKRSVFSLLQEHVNESTYDRLLTVGRLDEATTGMLILTTDGHLVHRIASPDQKVAKTYAVKTDRDAAADELQQLRGGVEIELEENGIHSTYTTRPARIEPLEDGTVMVTISEGKKRQVRRMFAAVGLEVTSLHRISIGGLHLDLLDLEEGGFVKMDERLLTQSVFEDVEDKRP